MSAKKSNDKKRSSTDTARRIWLAGVGAYGRAFTEAQEAIKDMSGETGRLFDDLVQKGESIEMAVDKKRKELVGKSGMSDLPIPEFSMPEFNMDERIAKMRSRLLRGEDVADNINGMEARLNTIEDKLDKIVTMLEAQSKPTKKAPSKKRTPKPKP